MQNTITLPHDDRESIELANSGAAYAYGWPPGHRGDYTVAGCQLHLVRAGLRSSVDLNQAQARALAAMLCAAADQADQRPYRPDLYAAAITNLQKDWTDA